MIYLLTLIAKIIKCYSSQNVWTIKNYSASRRYKPVTHVIFDLDGTILDDETLYSEIYSRVLQYFGKELTPSVRLSILGKQRRDAVNILRNSLNLSVSLQELNNKINKTKEEVLVNLKCKPGAERLIRHLHSKNIPMAVATNSSKKSYEAKIIDHKSLFSYFNHVVTGGSDNERLLGKPAPDIFLVAAKRFSDRPYPEKCLVFEDNPTGVEAAIRAGMQVVLIPECILPQSVIEEAEATLVIKSLLDFKPELFNLPPFPLCPDLP